MYNFGFIRLSPLSPRHRCDSDARTHTHRTFYTCMQTDTYFSNKYFHQQSPFTHDYYGALSLLVLLACIYSFFFVCARLCWLEIYTHTFFLDGFKSKWKTIIYLIFFLIGPRLSEIVSNSFYIFIMQRCAHSRKCGWFFGLSHSFEQHLI